VLRDGVILFQPTLGTIFSQLKNKTRYAMTRFILAAVFLLLSGGQLQAQTESFFIEEKPS
jgi:hypothetical protein